MPSPLLHSAAGAGICLLNGNARPHFVVPIMLASVLPDFDFVPGLLMGDPNRFHASYSHSIGFALLAAILAALVVRQDRWQVAGWVAAAWFTHSVLDSLTRDGRPPIGVPLFWPLVHEPFNLQLLPSLRHGGDKATPVEFFGEIFSSANSQAYLAEAALAVPLMLLCWLAGRQIAKARRAASTP